MSGAVIPCGLPDLPTHERGTDAGMVEHQEIDIARVEYVCGAVLVCVFAGHAHFRAALWLARRDPNRGRGLTLALLHSGYGLFKASGLACAVVILLIVLAAMGWDDWGGAVRVGVVGIVAWAGLAVVSALVSASGFLLAMSRRQPIWLDSKPRSLIRSQEWPPTGTGENRAVPLAGRSAKLCGIIIGFGLLVLLGGWLERPGLEWLDYAVAAVASILVATLFGLYFYVAERLDASDPRQCWNTGVDGSGLSSALPFR